MGAHRSSASRRVGSRRAVRSRSNRWLAAAAVAMSVAAVLVIGAPAALAQDGDDPAVTSSTVAPSTDPGDVPTTGVDLGVPATGDSRPEQMTESEKANRTLDFVIGGLVALAVVILIVGIVFWRRTQPARVASAGVNRRTTPAPVSASGSTWSASASGASSPADPPSGSPQSPAPTSAPPGATRQPSFTPHPTAPRQAAPAPASPAPGGATAAGATASGASTGGVRPQGLWASQGWGGPVAEEHGGRRAAPVLPPGFFGDGEAAAEDPQGGPGESTVSESPDPFGSQ